MSGQKATRRPTAGQAQGQGQGSRRGSARGANVGATAVAEPQQRRSLGLKANAPTRGGSRAFWYLKREGELSVVTDQDHNDALGIKKLDIFAPTDPQIEMGIVCKVRMTTLNGIDENITIFGSKDNDGSIYLQPSGARKVGEGKDTKWYNDRKFNDATTAQILSYVQQFVEVVE